MNFSNLVLTETQRENMIDFVVNLCNMGSKSECDEEGWNRWLKRIGLILICLIGMIANIVCIYLFKRLKSFKNSSYIFYLKFLSLSDTLCLLMELLKSLNKMFIQNFDNSMGDEITNNGNSPNNIFLVNLNDVNCRLLEFLTASFHLTSAWLICAFSIERCIAVNWPLLIRQLFNITRTKYICLIIFIIAPSIQLVRLFLIKSTCSDRSLDLFTDFFQINRTRHNCYSRCKCVHVGNSYGRFMLKYHSYFHQLVCLVVIPSLIVITCNSMVFYRIIQRRRMINSGKFFNFKINKSNQQSSQLQAQQQQQQQQQLLQQPQQQQQSQQPQSQSQQQSVPMIKVTLCNSGEPEITITNGGANANNAQQTRLKNNSSSRLSLNRSGMRMSEFSRQIQDGDSYNSNFMTNDDELASYSTTYEDTKSVDSKNLNSSFLKMKRNKLNKRNRDIKLALLMIFSGSFLLFVLPETLLNLYQHNYFEKFSLKNFAEMFNSRTAFFNSTNSDAIYSDGQTSLQSVCQDFNLYKLNPLFELFFMLKLLYFSSNFLAYLTLTTFSRIKRIRK